MSRNRRKDERSARRLPVSFWRPGEEDKRQTGYTSDISTSGMYISTNRPLPPGSRIRIAIGPVDRGFLIEGKVVRVLKVYGSHQTDQFPESNAKRIDITCIARHLVGNGFRRHVSATSGLTRTNPTGTFSRQSKIKQS